jgi:hypothetical protein
MLAGSCCDNVSPFASLSLAKGNFKGAPTA